MRLKHEAYFDTVPRSEEGFLQIQDQTQAGTISFLMDEELSVLWANDYFF